MAYISKNKNKKLEEIRKRLLSSKVYDFKKKEIVGFQCKNPSCLSKYSIDQFVPNKCMRCGSQLKPIT